MKKILHYYKQALTLTNRSGEIFFFSLLLSLLGGLPSMFGGMVQVLGLIMMFISMGFYFSLPLFLLERQKSKSVGFGKLTTVTLAHAKRLIIFTVMTITLMFLFLSAFLMLSFYLSQGNTGFLGNANQASQVLVYLNVIPALVLIGVAALATFTPIFYSLENNGWFSSVKKSVRLSVRHLDFIGVMIVLSIVLEVFLLAVFRNYGASPVHMFVRSAISGYQGLFFAAASLIFYQSLPSSKKIEQVPAKSIATVEKKVSKKPKKSSKKAK